MLQRYSLQPNFPWGTSKGHAVCQVLRHSTAADGGWLDVFWSNPLRFEAKRNIYPSIFTQDRPETSKIDRFSDELFMPCPKLLWNLRAFNKFQRWIHDDPCTCHQGLMPRRCYVRTVLASLLSIDQNLQGLWIRKNKMARNGECLYNLNDLDSYPSGPNLSPLMMASWLILLNLHKKKKKNIAFDSLSPVFLRTFLGLLWLLHAPPGSTSDDSFWRDLHHSMFGTF